MWTCHLIKQIFHSSSKNRSDMALHILLAVVEYLLNMFLPEKDIKTCILIESIDQMSDATFSNFLSLGSIYDFLVAMMFSPNPFKVQRGSQIALYNVVRNRVSRVQKRIFKRTACLLMSNTETL